MGIDITKITPAVRDRIHAALLAQDAASKRARTANAAPRMPVEPRAASKTTIPRGESPLEVKFARLWGALAPDIALVREYRFALPRKWRADFAHIDTKTLLEIEGGAWSSGRHTRGQGFLDDAEKYLEAALAGFIVIRLTAPQINAATLARIRDFIRARI